MTGWMGPWSPGEPLIGEPSMDDRDKTLPWSRSQWMFWNLPWLPVTKLFEVINEIKSKKLEHEKPEDYKEKKTQLVAQTEMNANIGKI